MTGLNNLEPDARIDILQTLLNQSMPMAWLYNAPQVSNGPNNQWYYVSTRARDDQLSKFHDLSILPSKDGARVNPLLTQADYDLTS